MGLTKEDLRRLLLASYVTQATVDTELGIEISYEELQETLSQAELSQLLLEGQTTPDEAGYYYVRIEDEETGEEKYFTVTRGNIRIENEDEDELICVNNATFDYYLDWFNGDANQEAGANTVKKMYTVKEIGKIEMITYTRTDNTYEFSTKTLDYARDTEIEQCMIQLELLIDFLQISASPDFLEAFEKLIIDQDITLRVFSMVTLETTQTERTYPIDITVDARKTMTFQGRRSGSSYAASSGDVDTVTTYRDVTYEIPRFELQRSTSTETENVDFELKLISADSWYFTADREVTKSTVTSYAYYDESGASTAFTPENPDDPMAGVPEYAVPGFSFDVTSLEELENRLRQEIGSNDINIDTQKSIINGKLQDRSDVQDLIDYYTDNNGYAADSGSGYSNYELIEYSAGITNINVTSENGTEKKVKETQRDMLTVGTMNYEDNTDAFLGLWKNDSGNYEEGASFNPDGKKVKYKDVYEDRVETAVVGDLFENADQMLFELLDYSENTQAYIPVMKYILYRYTGDEDYEVTDFETLLRMLGWNTTSVGGNYIVNIDRSPEEMVITDVDTLKRAFSGYSGDAMLQQYAQVFLDMQERYRVNAVFAAAVSISETGAGRAGNAINGKNNWFNIECTCGNSSHGRFETYASANQSIERFYWQIAEGSYYFTQGRYTVEEIGMIYCENADAPGGWIEHTIAFMTQMYEAAGIDLSPEFGGDFLEVAKQCHDYLKQNNYYYSSAANKSAGEYVYDGTSTGSNIPKPYPGEGNYIDCSAYVSWVLYEYGYTELAGWQQSTGTLLSLANRYGWTVKSGSEAQPGDILLNPGSHTEIYRGNGTSYNAGSTDAIRRDYDTCDPGGFQYSITVTAP